MRRMLVSRIASVLALVAAAIWLGGLVALGALVAPVVFSVVAMPSAADAMVIVFRRFDVVAMVCAALVLSVEAYHALRDKGGSRLSPWRRLAAVLAAVAAAVQGAWVSPHIAALHAMGAVRGLGPLGAELARWHDFAEWCGKSQVVLLVLLLALYLLDASARPSEKNGVDRNLQPADAGPRGRASGDSGTSG